MKRWGCKTCEKISEDAALLRASSPFDPADILAGCPHCKSSEGFIEICDEPQCDREASMGMPAPDGYRRTCYKHRPVS